MDTRNEGDVCVGIWSVIGVFLDVVVQEVIQSDCPLRFVLGGDTQNDLRWRVPSQTQVEQELR